MRYLLAICLTVFMLASCGAPDQADNAASPEDEQTQGETGQVTVIGNGKGVAQPEIPTVTAPPIVILPPPPAGSGVENSERRSNISLEDFGENTETDHPDSSENSGIDIDDIVNLGVGQSEGGTGEGLGGFGTIGSGNEGGGTGAGAGVAPQPGSAAYRQREMRNLLSNLKSYPIAYETPKAATQSTVFDVTLAIDASGDDSAVEGLPQTQSITENVAKLSEIVEAKLSGAAFEIKSANATTQFLHPTRETVWRWSVEPLQSGDHSLYLEIFAKIDDQDSIMLESFSDLITVDVAPSTDKPRLADDVRIYVSILGGLVSLILGLIALKGHYRNRREEKEE